MFSTFIQIFQRLDVTGYCSLDESFSLFSFQAAPSLLLYSYIPAIFIALILGFLIYKHNKTDQSAKAFMFFSGFYSLWVINAILQWIIIPNKALLFFWQLNGIFEIGFYISTLYLLISFLSKEKLSRKIKYLFISLFVLILVLSPSILNIQSYDYDSCEGQLGIMWKIIYAFEFLVSIIILIYSVIFSRKKENIKKKKEILLFSVPLFFFISLFTASNIGSGFLENYSFELFGPIGMVVFISFVSYLIVKYQAFSIKLLATQALIWGLIVLIGSQFFFIKSNTNMILNGITFVGIIVLGQYLIKSVKREVMQRESLEILTSQLFEANEKLKGLDKLKTEFVSLASHQLRSPLTAIKGYASMLVDGDYGEINKEAKEAIDRMYQSSKNLTIVVEDLLNVTKIESGGMKFEMVPFDLSKVVEDEAKDFSITAEKKGLKLIFEGDQSCMTNGDQEKIRQVIINLIDNSIKYTKEGQLNVSIRKNEKKVVFCVKDTGIGMTEEIKNSLFQKFARGDGARMNTTGSGLGLYLAKQIVEAHKGRVWVESDGLNKGSSFYMELEVI